MSLPIFRGLLVPRDAASGYPTRRTPTPLPGVSHLTGRATATERAVRQRLSRLYRGSHACRGRAGARRYGPAGRWPAHCRAGRRALCPALCRAPRGPLSSRTMPRTPRRAPCSAAWGAGRRTSRSTGRPTRWRPAPSRPKPGRQPRPAEAPGRGRRRGEAFSGVGDRSAVRPEGSDAGRPARAREGGRWVGRGRPGQASGGRSRSGGNANDRQRPCRTRGGLLVACPALACACPQDAYHHRKVTPPTQFTNRTGQSRPPRVTLRQECRRPSLAPGDCARRRTAVATPAAPPPPPRLAADARAAPCRAGGVLAPLGRAPRTAGRSSTTRPRSRNARTSTGTGTGTGTSRSRPITNWCTRSRPSSA